MIIFGLFFFLGGSDDIRVMANDGNLVAALALYHFTILVDVRVMEIWWLIIASERNWTVELSKMVVMSYS